MKNVVLIIFATLTTLVFANPTNAQNLPTGNSTPIAPIIEDALPSAFPSGVLANSVTTTTLNVAVTNPSNLSGLTGTQTTVSTVYSDGLGRQIQTVAQGAGSSNNDVVEPSFYDSMGRNLIRPLPYGVSGGGGNFRLNAFDEQQNYYRYPSAYNGRTPYDTSNAYSKLIVDDATLDRKTIALRPGAAYAGSNVGITKTVGANNQNDSVRMWEYNGYGSAPTTTAIWGDNTLMVYTTKDENGRLRIDYKDRQGRMILSKAQALNSIPSTTHLGWLCTYYVYDFYSQLRQVITPKAIDTLRQLNWNFSNAILSNLCFDYEYDETGRLLSNKKPGISPLRYIYDESDRTALIQDGTLSGTNQWLFTKYDVLGRPIISGKFLNNLGLSQSALQSILSGNTTTSNALLNLLLSKVYNNTYTPSSNIADAEIWTISLFDNYDYLPTGLNFSGAHVQALTNTSSSPLTSSHVMGKPTLSYVRVFDGLTATNQWESSAVYYDSRGLVIQTQSINFKGGHDTSSYSYLFNGRLAKSLSSVSNPTVGAGQIAAVRVFKIYQYDNWGRLLSTKQKVNDEPGYRNINSFIISENGLQTIQKTFGQTAETQKYLYRMWGALESINKSFYLGGGNGNFFGELLSYDYGFGQIDKVFPSGMQWRLKGSSGIQRSYGYAYDAAGRLTSATYRQKTATTSWSNSAEDYTASNMEYDANGNLRHMDQWGTKIGYTAPFKMDELTYSYKNGGLSNQLESVSDAITQDYGLGEFTEPTTGTPDYNYDANGNATSDANRQITSITYNSQDKPCLITFTNNRTIKFSYDANGALLSKLITENGIPSLIEYVSGLEYQHGILAAIPHDEGQVRPVQLSMQIGTFKWGFEYNYFIKDHQGNVRSVITEEVDSNWNIPTTPSLPGPGMKLYPGSDEFSSATFPHDTSITSGYTMGWRSYTVTNELANAGMEEATFDNVSSTRNAKPGSTDPSDQKDTRLNAAEGKIIGPSIMLKISAGDKLNIKTGAFYNTSDDTDHTSVPNAEQLATALLSALSGTGGYQTVNESGINPELTYGAYANSRFLSAMQDLKNRNTRDGQKPQGFLNYVVLDEQMQVVDDQSGFIQTKIPDSWNELIVPEIELKQSGYVIVFLSNESKMHIHFDNLNITHYKGKLLEESHYYPYGLTITKKASNAPDNNQLLGGNFLNRNEFSNGAGLNWYDFGARQYDPQIGRWHSPDPLSEMAANMTPYRYGMSNPAAFGDMGGLWDADEDDMDDGGREYGKNCPTYGGSEHHNSGAGREAFDEFMGDLSRFWSRGDADDLDDRNGGSPILAQEESIFNLGANQTEGGKDEQPGEAWPHSNEWNKDYIEKFHEWVGPYAYGEYVAGLKFSCEDFNFEHLVTFAYENGLPVNLYINGEWFDSRHTPLDAKEFCEKIADISRAQDVEANTISISLAEAKVGDMLLLPNEPDKEPGIVHHVQMIYQMDNVSIDILQGNVKDAVWGHRPLPIQAAKYTRSNGTYYRLYGDFRISPGYLYSSDFRPGAYTWNFMSFNKK